VKVNYDSSEEIIIERLQSCTWLNIIMTEPTELQISKFYINSCAHKYIYILNYALLCTMLLVTVSTNVEVELVLTSV
jgi:hypothetical protein